MLLPFLLLLVGRETLFVVRRISVRIERSEIRIARKLSKLEPKVLLRNFPSVEQIQDRREEPSRPTKKTPEDVLNGGNDEARTRDLMRDRHAL